MEIPCSNHVHLRWNSSGRRSKRPSFDELAVAEALILLANSDGGFCPSLPTAAPPKNFSSFPHPNSSPASVSAAVNVKDKKRYSPDTPLMANSSIFRPKKHRQQHQPASAFTTTSAAVNVYPPSTPITAVAHHDCLVCGKRFQSHQALGGHMTTHRLKPETATVSDDRGDGNSSAVKKVKIHECTSCHERFSTGQALGGHKRKHYEGPSIARKSSNCCRSISFHIGRDHNSGAATSLVSRPSIDIGRDDGGATTSLVSRPSIDLNMPPPEE